MATNPFLSSVLGWTLSPAARASAGAGALDAAANDVVPLRSCRRVTPRYAVRLRRLNADLRARVERMVRDHDAQAATQRDKERLMSYVVHDLKSPICSIDLHAQVTLREKNATASVRDAANQIRSDAARVARMLGNLLDLGRSDEGMLRPKRARVSLSALVVSVKCDLRTQAIAYDVTLASTVAAEVVVDVDEGLIRRVLGNLVENAIRHSPPGMTVKISASLGPLGTTIRVTDSGCGVPPGLRDTIFDRFVEGEAQAQARVPRVGHGLGLAFCKAAALAHGGAIWFENSQYGTAFCLRVP